MIGVYPLGTQLADTDLFDLERFVSAQDRVLELVLSELKAGKKRSHWMWFVFPQLRDLGSSPMAIRFGISSLDEAQAYLGHPILGARLAFCTKLVLQTKGLSLHDIFGSPDDMKFRSCMTLFAQAEAGAPQVFQRALDEYCDGQPDKRTLELLAIGPVQ